MALSLSSARHMFIGQAFGTSGGRANVGLNAAYVHATSGPAVALRFEARTADTIDAIYIFLDANGGTLANITMACDIYNEHATSVTQPGATLRDSSTTTTMPNAVDKWIKFAFATPYTPTVGEVLWAVFYNTAAAPATDFPNILTATNTLSPTTVAARFSGYSTTDGFSTAGTAQAEFPAVVVQGSSTFGNPITIGTAASANNALERGIILVPPVSVEIGGIEFQTASTTFTGFKIYAAATAPGGTPLYSYNLGSDTNQSRDELIGAKMFAGTKPVLTGGTTYRGVMTVASAATILTNAQIEDYASYSAVFDALIDNFSLCPKVIDNGAGGWTQSNDNFPNLQLIISDFPAGGGMLVHPGMAGGMRG